MTGAALASRALDIQQARPGRRSGFRIAHVVVAEFRRAIAAEQRYEDLKHNGAAALAREGIVRADVPRRVFEELYS